MPIRDLQAIDKVAQSIFAFLSTHDSAPEDVKAYEKIIVEHMVRKLEVFVTPSVSKRAAERAAESGLSIDQMRECDWHSQPKSFNDKGRKKFHWDHVVPVRQMTNELIENRSNLEKIKSILRTYDIAWITKEEDKQLSKCGFRSERRDPDAAYKCANIDLL